MGKRAFTLIELMVSIALTAIVVLFLYKALSSQNIANERLSKNFLKLDKKEKVFNLLYKDFIQSTLVKTEPLFNKSYDILYLQTRNSLHNIPFSYVAYYVNSKDKTLVRLESAYPFKIPLEDSDKIKYIFADTLIKDVEKLKLFKSGKSSQQENLPGMKMEKNLTKSSQNYLLFLGKKDMNMLFEVKIK